MYLPERYEKFYIGDKSIAYWSPWSNSEGGYWIIDQTIRDDLAKLCHEYMTITSNIETIQNIGVEDYKIMDKSRQDIHVKIADFIGVNKEECEWLKYILHHLDVFGDYWPGYSKQYNKKTSYKEHGPENMAYYIL